MEERLKSLRFYRCKLLSNGKFDTTKILVVPLRAHNKVFRVCRAPVHSRIEPTD